VLLTGVTGCLEALVAFPLPVAADTLSAAVGD
jgi:hypothetical protein